MKRVLIAHFRNDVVSGAERAIADMAKACDQDKWEFYMLVPGAGALADFYYQEGFKVVIKRIETRRRLYPGIHTLQSLFFLPFFKNQNFDLIIANTFPAISRVNLLAKFSKTPLVAYVREYFSFSVINRKTIRKASYVFAVSQDVRSHVKQVLPESRIKVVYDHFQYNELAVLKQEPSQEGPQVGFVGRLTAYKQPHLLLKAVPKIMQKFPLTRFRIVGAATSKSDQEYVQGLKELTKQLDISQQVEFTGHVNDPLSVIAGLDVICVPSEREPFPRVVLESLYLGTPVIAANSGGCREMIEDEVNGLLFEPNHAQSHDELAQKVILLLGDQNLRTRLVTEGQQSVKTKFNEQNTILAFQKFMKQAIYGNW